MAGLRTLAVGTRLWNDVVLLLSPFLRLRKTDSWSIMEPRTTQWLARAFGKLTDTPMQRHHWWRALLTLDRAAEGVDDGAICQVMATMVYDQVNIGAVACMEILPRRFQHVEARYGLRLRESHRVNSFSALDERSLLGNKGSGSR